MPTIVMLDVSLSMCRIVQNPKCPVEVRQLATVGIGSLLDYFAQNAQLEQTAFLVFSSLWELKQNFTRHHENIKNIIYDLELYDKSNIVNALRGLLSLKLNETLQSKQLNIILITDGLINSSSIETDARTNESFVGHFSGDCTDQSSDISLEQLQGFSDISCKIQLVCLAAQNEPALKYSIPFYKKLISTVDVATIDPPVIVGAGAKQSKRSAIWIPETTATELTIESSERLFTHIADIHYKPYHALLSFGNISSLVMVSPKPSDCCLEPTKNKFDASTIKRNDGRSEETFVSTKGKSFVYKLSDELTICGMLPLADIGSPAVVSRHLILPIHSNKHNETIKAEQILSQDSNALNKVIQSNGDPTLSIGSIISINESSSVLSEIGSEPASKPQTVSATESSDQDLSKQPSFCMILYAALKEENMAAVCLVGKNVELVDDWFGIIHSQIDSKKRTNLVLSLLKPGANPIPWLPNFRTLAAKVLVSCNNSLSAEEVAPSVKGPPKSYSSNTVIWLDSESVQADVSKILRHARRLPERASTFLKELNRVRRAAISYGFHDVLIGLASILEREKEIARMDPSKNSEFLAHIDKIIANLRANLNKDSFDSDLTLEFVKT